MSAQSDLKRCEKNYAETRIIEARLFCTCMDEQWLGSCERCCAKSGRPWRRDPEVHSDETTVNKFAAFWNNEEPFNILVQILTPHGDFPDIGDGNHPLKIAVLHI